MGLVRNLRDFVKPLIKSLPKAYEPTPSSQKPFSNIKNQGYFHEGKETENWRVEADSPDNDITENIETLRARSRDLYMSNEIARAILDKYKTKVVGTGLIPLPKINYQYLGISKEKATEYEKKIKHKFNTWAYSPNSDSTRMHDFYTLQSLVQLSWIMNGDVFAVVKRRATPEIDIELCVQLIEADRVINPSGATELIKGGVEFSEGGSLKNYWISGTHPGDKTSEVKNYPAFNSMGRRNILHIFEPERVGQRRGVPILAPVLRALKQLDRYKDAEMMAAVINANVAMVLEVDDPAKVINSAFAKQSSGMTETKKDTSEKTLSRQIKKQFGSGEIFITQKGESLKDFNTSRPNKNYKDFVDTVQAEIGASTGLPHEVMMSSFESSYSASKAALEEAEARFRVARKIIEKNFCQPIYEEFIIELIKNGDIDCKGFFDDTFVRHALTRCVWIGMGKASLDPLKDAKADEFNLRNMTVTRSMLAASRGFDFEDIVAERVEEERILKKLMKGGEKN